MGTSAEADQGFPGVVADELTGTAMDRPIRVVVFGGSFPEHSALSFLAALSTHPDIELVGGVYQSFGFGLSHRLRELVARRGVMAPIALAIHITRAVGPFLRNPRGSIALRRHAKRALERIFVTPDIHDPEVIERVRRMEADLGLIYGAPILRPELFNTPRLGTLGIHHGTLPHYRGRKTTFWEMFNGEPTAGVAIQRVNANLDAGDILAEGGVPIGRRGYYTVDREVHELGVQLYLDTILAIRRGIATPRPPISTATRRPYRDPRPLDVLRLTVRRVTRRSGSGERNVHSSAKEQRRVVIATETFHPEVGGGETQARTLADILKSRDYSVTLVTRRSRPDLPRREADQQGEIVRLSPTGPGRWKKWGLTFNALPALLVAARRADVMVVSGFRILGAPAVLATRLRRIPCLLKGDSRGEMSGEFFRAGAAQFHLTPGSLPVRLFVGLRNRVLLRAEGFVALSEEMTEEFEKAGVPRRRIFAIPNGVDVQTFRPADPVERSALRRRLDLPDGKLVVYTGRLVAYKGLPLLVKAWEKIRREGVGATLVLVGEGGGDIDACEAELRDSVHEQALDSSVRFTGAVANVADYLRAADVFVFPTMNEAFGLSLVEAMACGLPVVSTAVGGLRDFLVDGHNGVVVPVGDVEALQNALLRVLAGGRDVEAMGSAARDTAVGRFSIEAVADRWVETFESVRASQRTRTGT